MKSASKAFSHYVWQNTPAPEGYPEPKRTLEQELLYAGANERTLKFHDILKQGADLKKFEAGENLITMIAHGGVDAAIWFAENSAQSGLTLDRQDTYKWQKPHYWHVRMGVADNPEFEDRLHWQRGKYLRNTALILSVKKGWDHVSGAGRYGGPASEKEKKHKTRMGRATAAFLQNGANPDIQDACGNTALHIAVLHRDVRPIRALKESGARHDLRNKAGLLPVDMLDIKHEDIGPFLYQQTGNDVNCYIFTLKDRKDWLRAGAEVRHELENWPATQTTKARKPSLPRPEGL